MQTWSTSLSSKSKASYGKWQNTTKNSIRYVIQKTSASTKNKNEK